VLLTPVDPPERGIPEFHNLRISNVKVTNARRAFYANAYPEKPIPDVTFENVGIHAASGGSLNHCKGWSMNGVVLRAGSQVGLKNCTDVQLPAFEKK
jgi:hypothetical protein